MAHVKYPNKPKVPKGNKTQGVMKGYMNRMENYNKKCKEIDAMNKKLDKY